MVVPGLAAKRIQVAREEIQNWHKDLKQDRVRIKPVLQLTCR